MLVAILFVLGGIWAWRATRGSQATVVAGTTPSPEATLAQDLTSSPLHDTEAPSSAGEPTLVLTGAPRTPPQRVPRPQEPGAKPPGATRAPTPTPTRRYPAPTLVAPPDRSDPSDRATFEWQYEGPPLQEHQFFDLRIWSKETESHVAPDQRRGAEYRMRGSA